MFKKLNYKIHPTSEEGIKAAVEEINREKHKVIKFLPLGLEDKFCVLFHYDDHTEAPLEDLKQYSGHVPEQGTTQFNQQGGFDIMSLAQRYWFVLAIALVILLFYSYGRTPDV